MKAALLVSLLLAGPCVAGSGAAKLVQEACAGCHAERATPLSQLHLTRQQWQEAIERMAAYGVAVPDEKLQELLDYLARVYGTTPGEGGAHGVSSRPTTQWRTTQ